MAGDTKKRTQSSSEAQEKRYQLISKNTVQLFAESKGFDVSEEVIRVLTEDLNYRLREAVSEASQYLKHCRRSQLQVSDVIHALSDSHVPYVPADSTENKATAFQQLADSKVWSPVDRLVNLKDVVGEKVSPSTDHQPSYLEVCWLNTNPSLTQPSMDTMKCLSNYFTEITESAMSTVSPIRRLALADVICNPNLSYIRDQLLCFIEKWVKACVQSKKSVRPALELLDAVTNNRNVLFSVRKPAEKIVFVLLDCFILSDSSYVLECHYSNQIYAASILTKCLRSKDCKSIRGSMLSRCADVVADSTSPSVHILGSLRVILSLNVMDLFELLSPNMVNMWITSSQFSPLQLLILQHYIQDGIAAILNLIDTIKMSYVRVIQWARAIIDSLNITLTNLPLHISKTALPKPAVITQPVRSRCLKRTNHVTVTDESPKRRKVDLSEVFESGSAIIAQPKPIRFKHGDSKSVDGRRKKQRFTQYSEREGSKAGFENLYNKYHSLRQSKLRQCKDVVVSSESVLYQVL